ncbi:MAG: GNAT family N-acetyltransferase [Patescibacteria group bacterium]
MQLILPSLKYKASYIEALEESKNETEETQLNKPAENQSFEEFVQQLNDNAKGINLPEGYVPATMLWLIDKNKVIGRVQIRHELNDYLMKYGGHIGYYIRPSKRMMGYGTKILELALVYAEKLGLSKVLITCDDDNFGSRRIIEANGGILENIITVEKGKPKRRRYWITIL